VIVPFGPGAPIRKFWIASALLRYSGARRTIIGKMPVAAGFIEIAGGIAADRHLDGGRLISPGARPVGGQPFARIDIDLDGRLAERTWNTARSVMPCTGGKDRLDLVGGIGERLQIIAIQV